MVMEKIKAVLSPEHLMDAGAVFMGYVVATVAIGYLVPYLTVIPTGTQFGRVLAALIIVVVLAFVPVKTKYLVLGATVILIVEILAAFGIDLIAMLRAGYVATVNPT